MANKERGVFGHLTMVTYVHNSHLNIYSTDHNSLHSFIHIDLHTSDFMLPILHYNPYLLNKKIKNKQKFPSITLGFLNAFLRYFCITNPELFSHAKSNQEWGGGGLESPSQ